MANRTNRTGAKGGRSKGQKAQTRTQKWKPVFLAALADCGNVSDAIRVSGVARETVYAHRKSDEQFAAGWLQALEEAIDSLELAAFRRARDGVEVPIVIDGQVCFGIVGPDGKHVPSVPVDANKQPVPGFKVVPLMKRTYSDQLVSLLLQANRPGKFRSNTHITSDGSLGGDGEAEQIILIHSAPPAPVPVPPKAAAAIAAGKARGAGK